jgi:hypothetical protein
VQRQIPPHDVDHVPHARAQVRVDLEAGVLVAELGAAGHVEEPPVPAARGLVGELHLDHSGPVSGPPPFEPGVSDAYHDSPDEIWAWYTRGFGPLKQLAASLDAAALRALRDDLDAYHRHYQTPLGLNVRREYLVTVGVRR